MKKVVVKRFDVLSVAKIYAVMMLVMSLLIAVPYGLFIIIFSLIGAGTANNNSGFLLGGGGVLAGLAMMILLPIIYGVMGFVGGALSAAFYNIFSKMVGGIKVEVEDTF